MRRREFLSVSDRRIGGVLVYSLDRRIFRLSAESDKPAFLSAFSPKRKLWSLLPLLQGFFRATKLVQAFSVSIWSVS